MESERLRKGATYPAPVFLPPSSTTSSSLLFCSRIPAHLFHFPLIYLVIHILMRNRAALSRKGQVCFGGMCLDSCSWLKEPLWMTGHCPMSSSPQHCTSCSRKKSIYFHRRRICGEIPQLPSHSALLLSFFRYPCGVLWPRSSSCWLAVEAFRIAD